MKIDAFLTPFFPEAERQFDGHIMIMIDVLRASSSVCAALYNGAKEVIPSETHDKAVSLYSSLSRETRFLGGERHGLKPSGFDAGNSPLEYTEEAVKNRTVILATTNGTKLFNKARQAKVKIVTGFVNLNPVFVYLNRYFLSSEEDVKNANITVLCAGTNGRLSYEDTLCAGAMINALKNRHPDAEQTDTAFAAKNLYNLHENELNTFLNGCEHAKALKELGFEKDIEICFQLNKYPVVPLIEGKSITKFVEK